MMVMLVDSLTCFTRPFFVFAPFSGHPSSSHFLTLFRPFEVLFSVERRAHHRAWRGGFRIYLSTKFRKEIPSEICVKKRSAQDDGSGG